MLVKSKIKDIQSLAGKKYRDETGLFVVEGRKGVEELLATNPAQVQEVFGLDHWCQSHAQLLSATRFTVISEQELLKLAQLTTPNEVIAVVKKFQYPPLRVAGQFTVVCCGLQDPGNFGTIIRTADWFGVKQIVCSADTVDQYNPKVVQASMGSFSRVSIYYEELEKWLPAQQSVPIYAAMLEGPSLFSMEPFQQGILLIGNESKGVPAALLSNQVQPISIPGKGGAESLNVAVATGIFLSKLS
jgi:TrmH family RNA methyltransferase